MNFSPAQIFAVNWNFMNAMQKLHYGTDADFITDDMEYYLKESIIPEYVSADPFWAENSIDVIDYEQIGMRKYPNRHWNFPVKKVLLSNGIKLVKGCGCGRDMTSDAFHVVDKDGNELKTFKYFEDTVEPPKHLVERMLDDMEELSDEQEET